MNKYYCQINKQDTFAAYETLDEMPNKPLFAIVAENRNTCVKVSVLLRAEDVVALRNQLEEFLQNNVCYDFGK